MIKYIIIFIIVALSNAFAGQIIPKHKKEIFDLGHTILPKIPEIIPDISVGITFLFSILYYKRLTPETFKILTIMFVFRFFTNISTVLPAPKDKDKCEFRHFLPNYCNDFIFSGHATNIIVLSYFIGKPLWPWWPIISSLGIIASRNHYTVDVELAWMLFCCIIGRV